MGSNLDNHRAIRVLLLEDNQDLAFVMKQRLELAGHAVEVADEPMIAMGIAQTQTFDVCVFDIGLPGMDGYDAASRLKRSRLPNAIFIALSGHARDPARESAAGLTFDHFFEKPLSMETLLNLIDTLGRSGKI